MAEPLDPEKVFIVRQAIAEARAADATAQRLEESCVRLLILANVGGMIACLGIADALAGGKDSPVTLSFAALAGPMWLFFLGLLFGGLTVSLQRGRAVRDSEEHGRRALQALNDLGITVPTPPSPFSRPELRALPHLTKAINVLAIASLACFLVGAIWGLRRLGAASHFGSMVTPAPLGVNRPSGMISFMGSVATWLGDLISAGILMAALGALGTWRAQVLGGRRIQLAEQCLDAAHDFAVRVKIVRMEQIDIDQQMNGIRNSLLDFQRIFLRLNYYLTPPISEDVPQTLIKCFATLDTSFRELRGFSFREPESLGGDSIQATAASVQEKSRYQHANTTFYGLADDDRVGTDIAETERRLADALRPILKPNAGYFGQVITKITSWF